LLLDEVVAHLDPGRRKALFDELARLGAQVWMTGADPAAFADIGAAGEVFNVDSGRIAPRNLGAAPSRLNQSPRPRD
jgi:DNA replication and repair protein RecF